MTLIWFYTHLPAYCAIWLPIDLLQKFHNASVPCPTMHPFVTEMCTCQLQKGALCDICLMHYGICEMGLLVQLQVQVTQHTWDTVHYSTKHFLYISNKQHPTRSIGFTGESYANPYNIYLYNVHINVHINIYLYNEHGDMEQYKQLILYKITIISWSLLIRKCIYYQYSGDPL